MKKPLDQSLHSEISDLFAQESGDFAMGFYDNASEETIVINGREEFHAASTMKTPVMIEFFRQVYAGERDAVERVVIRNQFKSIVDSSQFSLSPEDDSEKGLYDRLGEQISLKDLNYLMIIRSSNLATNQMIDIIGARNTTETLEKAGITHTPVLRGVEDIAAYRAGLNNTTTAEDQLAIYTRLAKGEWVDETASQAMIEVLMDQEFNDIIPAMLPPSVKIAHKTGNIGGVRHDCGIIYIGQDRWYVLVLLSKNMEDEQAGTQMLARVSDRVYKYVMRTGR